jgi:hypothetical protein
MYNNRKTHILYLNLENGSSPAGSRLAGREVLVPGALAVDAPCCCCCCCCEGLGLHRLSPHSSSLMKKCSPGGASGVGERAQ